MSESGSHWQLSPRRPTRTRRTHQSNNQPGGQEELGSPAGWSTRSGPATTHATGSAECAVRRLDDPPAHHHPGWAPSAEQPAGRTTWPHHHPGCSTECRACKSSRLEDLPGTAMAQAGRQNAERLLVYRHAPSLPRSGGTMVSMQVRSADDPLFPNTDQDGRKWPRCKSGRLNYPPCPVTAQDGQKEPSM